jgi:hypothetical protein
MPRPEDIFNEDGTPKIIVVPMTNERICLACEMSSSVSGCEYHKRQTQLSSSQGLMQIIPVDWQWNK